MKSRFLDTYTGLLELESTLPSTAFKTRLPIPKRINSTKDGYLKRQFRRERDLDNIFKVRRVFFFFKTDDRTDEILFKEIVGQKEKVAEEKKPLRFLVKVEKPIPRPPTPGVDVPSPVSRNFDVEKMNFLSILRKTKNKTNASFICRRFYVAVRFRIWSVE